MSHVWHLPSNNHRWCNKGQRPPGIAGFVRQRWKGRSHKETQTPSLPPWQGDSLRISTRAPLGHGTWGMGPRQRMTIFRPAGRDHHPGSANLFLHFLFAWGDPLTLRPATCLTIPHPACESPAFVTRLCLLFSASASHARAKSTSG